MLQGTDRIRGRPSPDGGTSRNGTHRAPPPLLCASTKQRPFPHRRLCCPLGSTSTTAASDAHPAHHSLPGTTGYRARFADSFKSPQAVGPGRASPVPAVTSCTFRAPYAEESLTAANQALHRFHGLHPDFGGSALPTPTLTGGPLTTPQASHHATDRSVAPPTRAFDTGLRPDPFPNRAASLLPGLLAVTRTGLTPASNDELPTISHPLPHSDLLSTGRTNDRG